MKFANIDLFYYNNYIPGNSHYWNFGDQIQLIAIEELYKKMGISLEDLVLIPSGSLNSYTKENVILPLNICMQKSKGLDYSWLSQNIFPVFLGINLQTPYLTKTMVEFFKQYQPIGCRDEWTYNVLQSYKIESYLNGCITATIFPTRTKLNTYNKIFLIDIPNSLREFIPNEISDNAIETTNNFFGNIEDIVPDLDVRNYVMQKYSVLRDSARLVVTSRLHVAAPCASMGIPVIIVKNNLPNTFSWIDRIVPTYDKQQFSSIDWNPIPINYEQNKNNILNIAKNKLSGNIISISEMENVTNFYLSHSTNQSNKNRTLFQDFTEFLSNTWTKKTNLNYAIWGITDIAESLYYYLCENYPYVKLKNVYDKYNKITFHGICSKSPSTITLLDDVFIFVCTSQAKVEAKEIFTRINKSSDSFFMPGFMDEKYNKHICE